MQSSQDESGDATVQDQRALNRLVIKNTFYLTASQAFTIPLAIVVNAVMARYLGPSDFGFLYLASAICAFGFLLVNWGHDGVLPALVSQDRSRAGALLATSVVWRACLAIVVSAALALACFLLGYGSTFQWILALSCLGATLSAVLNSSKDTIRGFERADIVSYTHVGTQLLTALVVVPVLVFGGGTRAVLLAQAAPYLLVSFLVWRVLTSVGVGRLLISREALTALARGGTPFVFFGLAMALQPNIDAVYLSKLGTAEAMGWFAVSRRLTGVLVFPAVALVDALYPTLCRLHVGEPKEFARVTRGALNSVSLLVMPVALGCALYPDIGVAIFNRKSFGPSEDNLRVLSLFLLLVYFSMPLGACILAAGKQRAWSIVQSLCVVISLVLDPVLIRYFQRHTGNGGLGVCVACVVSEVVVVGCGVALAPRGVFDRKLLKSIGLAAVAGGGMAVAAWLMRPVVTPYVAAPVSVVLYAALLWLLGGISKEDAASLKGFVARKLSRSR
ncbi:MAG: oligosaccharide flippase family protein [Polyangiaceae bacterium]